MLCSLLGATVTSWKVGGKEKFFVSTKTATDSSKPVSGVEPAEVCYSMISPPEAGSKRGY